MNNVNPNTVILLGIAALTANLPSALVALLVNNVNPNTVAKTP